MAKKRKSGGMSAADLRAHEARVEWSRKFRKQQEWERKWSIPLQLLGYGFMALVAVYILVGLIREDAKPDTPQEKLERQLNDGQREVCRKWGDTVEGC